MYVVRVRPRYQDQDVEQHIYRIRFETCYPQQPTNEYEKPEDGGRNCGIVRNKVIERLDPTQTQNLDIDPGIDSETRRKIPFV